MKKTLILIIVGLIAVIFFMRECRPPTPPLEPIIEIVTDTIRDTIAGGVKYVPYPEYIDTGSVQWKEILRDVDTSAILIDYFSTVFYCDTILSDSTGFIVVKDSIRMNRIKSRYASFKLYSTDINTTTTITQPVKLRNKIFVGLGVGGNPTSFGMDFSIMLLNKKENAYTLSYDVLNKDIRFTMYWKIRF